MKKFQFTTAFSKSVAALLLQYRNAPATLKPQFLEIYLNNFIENGEEIIQCLNGDYNQLSDWVFWKNSFPKGYPFINTSLNSKTPEYLLTIFMLLFIVNHNIQQPDLYELENLSTLNINLNTINTFISSLVMDFDFEQYGELDFNSNYLPNNMVAEYSGVLYKNELMINQINNAPINFNILFDDDIINLVRMIDKEILTTGISFMQMQAILLLMHSSTFYPEHIHKIAKEIIMIFKDLLANVRIKKIEIDPTIASGAIRIGFKETTGIKIFFALENGDRYCLRIDFPHDGEEFLHYNLHESELKSKYNNLEAILLKSKYNNLEAIFFKFGHLYWFRSNFISKLDALSPTIDTNEYQNYSSFRDDMLKLFHEQGHYRMFSSDISKENMMEFISSFGEALLCTQVSDTLFTPTNVDNINEELNNIKVRDLLSNTLAIYQRCIIEEQILEITHSETLSKLKDILLHSLFDTFSEIMTQYGTYEDFEKCDLKDILLFLL